MRTIYANNLKDDVRKLRESLSICSVYGGLSDCDRIEADKLSDALERFEDRVLYADEEEET